MMPSSAPQEPVSRPQPFQDFAAGFFIVAIAILSVISILGVWRVFGGDVIMKSFSTLGLLAVVAIALIVAGRYFDKSEAGGITSAAPVFKSIRQITLGVLIVAAAGFALLGVMAIWEVIAEKETLYRALASLGIIGFGAFVSVMVCLERENNHAARQSMGPLILVLFLVAWLLLSIFN